MLNVEIIRISGKHSLKKKKIERYDLKLYINISFLF